MRGKSARAQRKAPGGGKSVNMKLKELIGNIPVLKLSADPETEITGISYDSRKTKPGDLFVAIRGFETDGHRYIPAAVKNGAAAVLCEEEPREETPCILVENSRLALAQCSSVFFGDPSREMRIIGITGTSGKTSVSVLLKQVLEKERGLRVGLIGTNGIVIGSEELPSEHTTPESYELQHLFREMKNRGCSHVVMEVSSHALALDRVACVHFDTAVYTNLSQDHLDFHGNMEDYAAAKKKLFSMCAAACVNADDEWADYMISGTQCPILRFGQSESAQLRAENPAFLTDRVQFDCCLGDMRVPAELPIPGALSVSNALAVIASAMGEGISLAECAAALTDVHGVKGRLESISTERGFSILRDYSHKPDALEKVLRSLRPSTAGRLICVFGCGGDRDRTKRPLMGKIALQNADFVIVTSDNPRTENPEAIIDEIAAGMKESDTPWIRICDRIEAIHHALDMASDGDVVLLAGKGHEDYQVIGHEKRHMDEREIVLDYLNRI